MKILKLLWMYIKEHFFTGIMIVVVSLMNFSIFYLYKLPMEGYFYGLGLSAVILLCIGLFGFLRSVKKYREYEEILKACCDEMKNLPKPKNAIQDISNEIITKLSESRTELLNNTQATITDMTDYYTMWAHQIKTPISAIQLLIQTSEQSDENTELSEQLFKIEQYADMVLCYLKSESISNDFVIKPIKLDAVLKQQFKKFSKSFYRKKISLDYIPTEKIIISDEKWLSFVIGQILSNSLKYTPRNGTIKVYYESFENKSSLVISDNGIGIRAEDLPRIGQRGFTGYNGHNDKKSTGIGLYLCYKICKKLSHKIIITSVISGGTKVRIVFLGS